MTGKRFLIAIALTPLWLAGCMLPQPDTPIIPPGVDLPMTQERAGAQDSQPQAPAETEPPAMAQAEDALLTGTVVGAEARAIQANPEGGAGRSVRQELGRDGAFALTLTPGVYRIELVVDGAVAVLEPRLTIAAGEDREVVLRIERDPLSVRLEEAPPEEPASPEAGATDGQAP